MDEREGNRKKFDLEDRTFEFAREVIAFVNKLKKTLANIEIGKQLNSKRKQKTESKIKNSK